MNIYKPRTIEEAISDLQRFLESDLWYAFNEEFKTETDMILYLEDHFTILKKQIKEVKRNGMEKTD